MARESVMRDSHSLAKEIGRSYENPSVETFAEPLDGISILVVEDDADLREILCETLESYGGRVCWAANGKEAISRFEQNRVEIILSDVRMPGGDGLDLLKSIRERHPSNPPFLFVSGHADLAEKEAIERGAQGLFWKPFDPEHLVASIRQHARPAPALRAH